MASVFLSYDRGDVGRARPLAAALEKAGHAVWWDRHIKGGAQYSKEIEQALARAEAVIVLWSARSVESAWVRDEAAEGRDSGRLIPVLIDGIEPPLGFRQFQTIDLSRWKGRGKSPAFDQLMRTVDDLGGGKSETRTKLPTAPKPARWGSRHGAAAIILVGVLVAALFAGWRLANGNGGGSTVTVVAADQTTASKNIARDLMVMLGSLQSVRRSAMTLVESDGHDSADADLLLKVNAGNREPEANLVLLSGNDRTILWSKDFKPPSANPSDLKQQLAYTAARVLDCALEGLNPKAKRRLDPVTLKLYLNGCAKFSELIGTNTTEIIPLFDQVTKAAPWFEPGWAKLLLSESLITDLPGNTQDRIEPGRVRQHIAQARAVNPRLVEATLAEISLLPSTAFTRRAELIDQALAIEPENAFLLSARSKLYASVGRLNDATLDAKRASQLEPLSPAFRHTYISVLSHAGRLEAAFEELENAERLWPGASNLIDARFRLHIFYGDPKEALKLVRKGITNYPASVELVLDARIDPSPEKIGRAKALIRHSLPLRPEASTGPIHGYGQFGMAEELFAILNPSIHTEPELFSVLFRPPFRDFRRDARFIPLAARFGLVEYWQSRGIWPDYCRDPDLPYDCKAEAAKFRARNSAP